MHTKTAFSVLSAAALTLFANPANAQTPSNDDYEEESAIDEVIVTGSSIKRQDLESSLPVQIITSDDIERSGVTTTADLIARLPAMQGFLTEGDSVGEEGGGGGAQTASIHNLGDSYTLTLLNGRRIAPVDSGSRVDVGNIPAHLIERIEILTDGASAVYGSDAIGGVLNIILKQSIDRINVAARFDSPSRTGGGSSSISITGGLGDYETDGYSAIFSFSQNSRDSIKSIDRDFAKTGIITLSDSASKYPLRFFNGSPNAIPGNAEVRWWVNPDLPYQDDSVLTVTDKDGNEIPNTRNVFVEGELMFAGVGNEGDANYVAPNFIVRQLNPYRLENGDCAPANAPVGNWCYFDFTSALETNPEIARDSLYGQFNFKVSDNLHGFASALISSHSLTSRTAPYPTGNVAISQDSQLAADYILKYLQNVPKANLACNLEEESVTEDGIQQSRVKIDANGMASCAVDEDGNKQQAGTSGTWRALPAGIRATEYEISTDNFVFGLEGRANTIDYRAGVTVASTEAALSYPDGWLYSDSFLDLIFNGELNIFVPLSELPANTAEILAPTIYHGDWNNEQVDMLVIDGTLSLPLFTMQGGDAHVAAGFDHRTTSYLRTVAPANANKELLYLARGVPYDFERNQLGLFGEILLPVQDNLEISGSLRYDDISGVSGSSGVGGEFAPVSTQAFDHLTYKASVRWDIRDDLAFRASTGTGFRAPDMRQIAEPSIEFKDTSNTYDCPFDASNDPDNKKAWCVAPKDFQTVVFREGNPDLDAETSEQFSFGIVYNSNSFNASIDYWSVDQSDLVDVIAEEGEIFADPVKYYDDFVYKVNASTQRKELAILQRIDNLSSSGSSGIDFRVEKSFDLSAVQLTLRAQGTHLLESRSGDQHGEVGRFNPDGSVAFRNIIVYAAELLHSNDFTHTVQLSYRSGYDDQAQKLSEILPSGDLGAEVVVNRKVDEYQTIDYQLRYTPSTLPDLSVLVGVNNVLDQDPPLSIRTTGSHQRGYDPRYTDVFGQTLYVGVDYNF